MIDGDKVIFKGGVTVHIPFTVKQVIGEYVELLEVSGHWPKEDFQVVTHVSSEVLELFLAIQKVTYWNDRSSTGLQVDLVSAPVNDGGTEIVVGQNWSTNDPAACLRYLVDKVSDGSRQELLETVRTLLTEL